MKGGEKERERERERAWTRYSLNAAGLKDLYFIDIDHGRPVSRVNKGCCPCLTRTRAGAQGFWVSTRGRQISHDEILRFQGLDRKWIKSRGVGDRQIRLMAGNAWSVNVAARVLFQILKCLNLAPGSCKLRDPWAACDRPGRNARKRPASAMA